MSKRNKIIISLALTVFVVISLLVSLVVVFAEEQEIVRNLNAVCRVYNADCHVSASYAYGNKTTNSYLEAQDFTVSGLIDDNKFLNFDNNEQTKNNFQDKMLKPTSDIVLTKENNSVIFEFQFANFGLDELNVTVWLEKISDETNVEVKYSADGKIWKSGSKVFSVDGKTGATANSASYFVKVSLIDDNKTYSFNQNFALTILNNF